jgi:hypothetical protein
MLQSMRLGAHDQEVQVGGMGAQGQEGWLHGVRRYMEGGKGACGEERMAQGEGGGGGGGS